MCAAFSAVPARADIFSFFDGGNDPVITGPREMTLTAQPDGMYYVRALVNNTPIKFIIDTGSDDIVLTRKDAQRAGVDVSKLQYSEDYDAATGSGVEADTTVNRLSVGPATFSNVDVSVSEDSNGASLLGMTFLHRLKSVEMSGDHLYLRW